MIHCLKNITFPKSGEYQTGGEFEPIMFFIDALLESSQFDILLGYFSSSAMHVLALGFAKFISSGGKIRMIINHVLSTKDKEILTQPVAEKFPVEDFFKVKEALDEYGQHFFDCLAWLIKAKRIQIKAVRPISNKGISHYKSGLFSDGTEVVRFKSSCNFTAMGLLENLEELDVKCSWESERDQSAISDYQNYFNDIFEGKADFLQYLNFDQIEEAIITEFGDKELSELIYQEKNLLEKRWGGGVHPSLERILNRAIEKVEKYLAEPRLPEFVQIREYQHQAFQAWRENNYQGIFAMATGTGKTITALNCILNIFYQEEYYQIIILVPTQVLVEQWQEECQRFNFMTNVITISSKSNYHNALQSIISKTRLITKISFVMIATYQSFRNLKVFDQLNKLPQSTILIADEVHNLGSVGLKRLLPSIQFTRKIGLSATPKRHYDTEGYTQIEAFFDDPAPHCISFPLERAIAEGFLCEYFYYPQIVHLTVEEMDAYAAISVELMKYFDTKSNRFYENDASKMLLLKRKDIIHKAINKLEAFSAILKQITGEIGYLRYCFIYAPEGVDDRLGEVEDFEEGTEELKIIDQYAATVRTLLPNVRVAKYTSTTHDRQHILTAFEKGDIDVLLSMKCLDEGVDIPRTEFGIFCSSTGNPRQFVQRRGRILRKHPQKDFAKIYDLVVVPESNPSSPNFALERSLLRNELSRVADFADLALNKWYTSEALTKELEVFELSLDSICQKMKGE